MRGKEKKREKKREKKKREKRKMHFGKTREIPMVTGEKRRALEEIDWEDSDQSPTSCSSFSFPYFSIVSCDRLIIIANNKSNHKLI